MPGTEPDGPLGKADSQADSQDNSALEWREIGKNFADDLLD
jgi:hypothetical protein